MSFSEKELKQHCEIILKQRKIRNKIIVLCEGVIPREQGRPSPQSYGRMDALPDSNFYKACIPSDWRNSRPEFFNCGDCNNVVNTYFTLLEMIEEDIDNQYFHPKKIFAIVDLDIQIRPIPNYRFSSTQEIFCNLYDKIKINETNAKAEESYEIFVTGLIHKEAYFLVPALQSIFDGYSIQPFYKDSKLLLEDIYLAMSRDLCSDADLKANFAIACSRINHCSGLDFSGIDKLKDSWINEFQNAIDDNRKHELIFSLLTIRKAKKEYWHQVQPSQEWSRNASVYRDQLSLEIARDFYAKQTDDEAAAKYHIPYFFKMLRKFV